MIVIGLLLVVFPGFLAAEGTRCRGVPFGEDRRWYSTGECTAFPEEQDEILRYVEAGMEAKTEFEIAAKKEAMYRQEGLRTMDFGKLELWYTAKKLREDQKNRMEVGFMKAMELAQKHYNLPGPWWTAKVASGPMRGFRGMGSPEFFYDRDPVTGEFSPLFREVRAPDGRNHHFKIEPGNGRLGTTQPDGQIFITLEGFKMVSQSGNSGLLAFLLYHEVANFEQLTGGGWDTVEEVELRSYRRSLKRAKLFDLSAELRQAFNETRKEYKPQGLLGRIFPWIDRRKAFPTAEEEAAYQREFWKQEQELERIRFEREMLAQRLEEERRLRRQKGGMKDAPAESSSGGSSEAWSSGGGCGLSSISCLPPPPRIQPKPVVSYRAICLQCYEDLRELATQACEGPGSVTQEQLSAMDWYPTEGKIFATKGPKLTRCAEELLKRLLEAHGQAGPGEKPQAWRVNQQAQELLERYPPPPEPEPAAPSWGDPYLDDDRGSRQPRERDCRWEPKIGATACEY